MSRYLCKQAPGIFLQTFVWIFHIWAASTQLSVYLWQRLLSSGMKTVQKILASCLIRPKWVSRWRDSRWKQIPLKSRVRLRFPTWKKKHSRNHWQGLNHQTWDLGSDTLYWQRIDSYYLLLPSTAGLSVCPVCHELNCPLFMETYMHYCWPFVFPQFISFLILWMHTCRYSYKHRIYTEIKKYSRALPDTLLVCSQSFLLNLLFLVKALLN